MGEINCNSKHLKKGDPLPPYTGKLRIYNMRFCPFAHRTILALNAKKIDYEVVNINLADKPEWFTTKNSFGKVPAIEIQEDITICESLVTVEYLDDVYPQRPLLPKDPLKKAMDKIIIEACAPIQQIMYKIIENPAAITEDMDKAYYKALDFLRDQLKGRGTKFLDGSEPGFADYMIWPWFERLMAFKNLDKRANINAKEYKLLAEYLENMRKDPAVDSYLIPDDVYAKMIESFKRGDASNYDILLEN